VTEASQPFELLLTVSRDRQGTLGAQIEGQLRQAIRGGALRAGSRLPSTRELASQLGVSRRITVDAYTQLASEGYLLLRQGAQPRVADIATLTVLAGADPVERATPPVVRFDFRPSRPDVSLFPRSAWIRCLREAVTNIGNDDLSYGDAIGVEQLRSELADYLGRVRGVVAAPDRVVVTTGYLQGLGLICLSLAARGARRIGLEDPSSSEEPLIAERAGLQPVRIPVDDLGIRVDQLGRADVDAVVLTPAHQHPTGVVLAPERRAALVAWLRARDAIAVEDDYDAEYRYDRPPVGALQGLDPDRVVYSGTASKVLAPALRLGWFVVPAQLLDAVRREKLLADHGSPRIEQLAFAYFLERGDLDRHLRRMRARYHARRDRMIETLAAELPDAVVHGIAAGLHVTVELPPTDDEAAISREADLRHIALSTMRDYRPAPTGLPPTLILGYSQVSETRIRSGIRELAAAVRATRRDAIHARAPMRRAVARPTPGRSPTS
jgi:GntR family transcriptional regulator/MocR family aminotransferase